MRSPCPRCLKQLSGDPEDGSIHTCTPTPFARSLESRIEGLEGGLLKVIEHHHKVNLAAGRDPRKSHTIELCQKALDELDSRR